MFPKYLTPGKKKFFLNTLVLIEMEENFRNEDSRRTVFTPVHRPPAGATECLRFRWPVYV